MRALLPVSRQMIMTRNTFPILIICLFISTIINGEWTSVSKITNCRFDDHNITATFEDNTCQDEWPMIMSNEILEEINDIIDNSISIWLGATLTVLESCSNREECQDKFLWHNDFQFKANDETDSKLRVEFVNPTEATKCIILRNGNLITNTDCSNKHHVLCSRECDNLVWTPTNVDGCDYALVKKPFSIYSEAKTFCNDHESDPVMMKTSNQFEGFRDRVITTNTWVGLNKTNFDSCSGNPGDCRDKFIWADGDTFVGEEVNIQFSNPNHKCAAIKNDDGNNYDIVDESCQIPTSRTGSYYALCQKCPPKRELDSQFSSLIHPDYNFPNIIINYLIFKSLNTAII